MTKLFTLCFVTLLGLGLAIPDAHARRMGGGGNIGKQQQMAPAPQKATQTPTAPASSGASKWLGPLAGLAIGGMLASLFMGEGFGGAAGSILMILALVAAAFFIFRMLRRPRQQAMQYAGHTERVTPEGTAADGGSGAATSVSRSTRPAWFDEERFLREAKKHFIRLQAANDRGDINDIREFVTPEMVAEISLQIQERGDKPNSTEVVTLNAEIADVITETESVMASVRFSGLIRESDSVPPEAFTEFWHIQRSLAQADAPWLIAGIQQA